MSVKTHFRTVTGWPRSVAGLTTLSGLGAFGLVLVLLSFQGQRGFASPAPNSAEGAEPTALPLIASDSLARRIPAGHVAVGVRMKADSVPLASLHVGAALDALVTMPAAPEGSGVVGAVVTGARIVAVSAKSDHADVLLAVPSADAMVLGHLARGGLPTAYTVRDPSDGASTPPVLTTDDMRAYLKLAQPKTTSLSLHEAPLAAPPQVSPGAPEVSAVHFVVYTGVDLALIEQRFAVSSAALQAANPYLQLSEPLVVGTELVVPDLYGFLYRVAPEDTLDSVSQRYAVTPERLQAVNGLLPGVQLLGGSGLLIPAGPPGSLPAAARANGQ